LSSENVEIVSVDGVAPSYVFERYFSVLAPFAAGDKEKEFADAFVLKALLDLAEARGYQIHVISSDSDMARFAEQH
ncbi:PIN domain-containing protein, partial [Pseudomonas syringae]|uniref:PIN domain-containing protein n=2 Tax=Pseudomonas TaxID=286 RepID=UPI00164B9382